jgi:hypothetical protein
MKSGLVNRRIADARQAFLRSIMVLLMRAQWKIVFGTGIAAAVAASRAIYAPKFLVNFDAANFALAIREFNPGMDQPQPPGYPLFVMLLKLLDLVLHDARLDLLVAGLIGSIAAVLLLWGLANSMYGETAGYLSALILAAQPLFWYAGIANPVRVYLAVISVTTAWAGWMCLSKRPSGVPFLVMAVLLGMLSGFRPETLLLFAPLFVGVGLRARVPPIPFAVAALLLAVSAGSWISVLAYKAGGLRPFLEMNFEYLRANSHDYTLAFGASRPVAMETVRRPLPGTSCRRLLGRGLCCSRGHDFLLHLAPGAVSSWHYGFCRPFYFTHSCTFAIWIRLSLPRPSCASPAAGHSRT